MAWLIIVLVVAVLVRITLRINYPLAQSNDTPTYLHLANSLKNHNGFERYNGTRTPGYPILLMAADTDENIYFMQLVMGLLTTLLVFFLAWMVGGRAWFAGIIALAHTLNLGQLFFEAAVLSETAATFFLFCIMSGLAFIYMSTGDSTNLPEPDLSLPMSLRFGGFNPLVISISLVIGFLSSAVAMTRPLFAFIPFLGSLFLVFFWRAAPLKIRLGSAFLAVLPSLTVLLLWVNFIYTRFNIVGMDSIGGYHLVNHTTSFFELAPIEYAPIRDSFLEFRAARITTSGSPINTIWDAIPTLMTQTKLNYYSLGRLMGEISRRLIHDHPWLYFQNLALGWWWFWRVGVFWLPENIINLSLRAVAGKLMLAERISLFGINLLFLAGSLALLRPRIRQLFKMDVFLWFAVSAVWVTSILQTLAEHGDNPRFLAPLQSLVVLIVGVWLMRSTEFLKQSLSKSQTNITGKKAVEK